MSFIKNSIFGTFRDPCNPFKVRIKWDLMTDVEKEAGENKKPFVWQNPTRLEFNFDRQFQRFPLLTDRNWVAHKNGTSGFSLLMQSLINQTNVDRICLYFQTKSRIKQFATQKHVYEVQQTVFEKPADSFKRA